MTQNRARELEARALARLATDGSLAGWRDGGLARSSDAVPRALVGRREARHLQPAARRCRSAADPSARVPPNGAALTATRFT